MVRRVLGSQNVQSGPITLVATLPPPVGYVPWSFLPNGECTPALWHRHWQSEREKGWDGKHEREKKKEKDWEVKEEQTSLNVGNSSLLFFFLNWRIQETRWSFSHLLISNKMAAEFSLYRLKLPKLKGLLFIYSWLKEDRERLCMSNRQTDRVNDWRERRGTM